MPQEPKKRHSRQRQGKRRAAIKLAVQKGIACPNCNNTTLPHMVCKDCGYYKGREIRPKETKEKKRTRRSSKLNNENTL